MNDVSPTAPLEEVIIYHENGQVAERGFRQQDQWHGEWLKADAEGRPQCLMRFVHGLLDGDGQVFDEEEHVQVKVSYRKGVRHGDMVVMKHGLVQFSAGYVNGKQEGAARTFSNQGVVMSEIEYRAGVRHGVARWFDETGRLVKQSHYRNNQLDGAMEEYDAHGHVTTRALYRANRLDGMYQRTDEKGIVIEEREYRHGRFIGNSSTIHTPGVGPHTEGSAHLKPHTRGRRPWWKVWMPDLWRKTFAP